VRIGVLTGGGDCPGLNAALRSISFAAEEQGDEVLGIEMGWKGLVENLTMPLPLSLMDEQIDRGGTIIGSSRTNPCKNEADWQKVQQNFRNLGLDALIALGGEDTLGVALRLNQAGYPTIGLPKTMDNDLSGTDFTFGFDSAVRVATDSADRLKDTARSHRRVMVMETMGRHAGWVALYSGLASGADWILIPEVAPELEAMCEHLRGLHKRGKSYAIVVVSEGIELATHEDPDAPRDAFGHRVLGERGVGEYVCKYIEENTGLEARMTRLGHVERGGSPSPFDRILATRLGLKAVDLVREGKFGYMTSLQGQEIGAVPLADAVAKLKLVPLSLWDEASRLFR
jgi:6-phosphofructokinase 1